jgi:hypothetical protein
MRLPCRWSTLTYLIRMYTHTHTHTASGALWHLRHQVCIYVCMYVCMYVCVHTHTHAASQAFWNLRTKFYTCIYVHTCYVLTNPPIRKDSKETYYRGKRDLLEAKETHVLTKPRIHKEFVRSKDFVNLCPNFFYFTKTANPMVPPCTTLQKKIWSNHIVNCTCLDTFSCR